LKYISHFGYVYLDTINDYIKNFLRKDIAWERAFTSLIQQAVRPGCVAIDIGAHIGTHVVTLSQAVGPEGIVYAFEPQDKIFAELYMNMRANQCDNVIPLHCALGNEEGVMKMRNDVPANEGASYVMKAGDGHDVLMLRLDDFHFRNVSFIKIDTENTEYAVLMGAYETIMANRPIILIEIQGNGVRAERNKENMAAQALQVKDLLQRLEYDVHHLGNADYLALPRMLHEKK
jgi:FkbM family methyltransferase